MRSESTHARHTATIALSVLVVGVTLLAGALAALTPVTRSTFENPNVSTAARPVQLPGPASAACGEVPVPLGSASTYAVLSGAGVTNTGQTVLTGDIGAGPGSSVTGFPPGTYTGTENIANTASAGAEASLTTAYNNASGRSNCAVTVAGNIGGQTLTPGLYRSTSSLAISSGDLTLNGGGNPNGVFVFQIASALTTTSGRAVLLTNGAQAGNVYWSIGSSATLGTTSTMKGTLMAYASITLATGAHLDGRALARTGDVTLASNTVVVPVVTSVSTYSVNFTETGLPAATSWSATLGGVPGSSTTTTLGFTVANGSFDFQIGAMATFAATPSSGLVTVNGANVEKAIAFAAAGTAGVYTVTFTESGLVPGTTWSVAMDGGAVSSTAVTVAFVAASGTHAYTVGGVSGYNATPSSGNETVNGANAGQSVSFSSANGTGPGGGGGGGGPAGFPSWGWLLVGVAIVAALLGGAALVLRRRGKQPSPTPPA